jgi:hypothetical protein
MADYPGSWTKAVRDRIVLSMHRQETLAAWAAMSVMCAEYFYPNRAAVPVTDRRWLFRTKTAPNDFRIWIGDYVRKDWKPHWGHLSLRISEHEGAQGWTVHPDGTPRSNTQITSFVVGRLFIQTYSCPFPEILHSDKIVDAVDSKLVQILPPRGRALRLTIGRQTRSSVRFLNALMRQGWRFNCGGLGARRASQSKNSCTNCPPLPVLARSHHLRQVRASRATDIVEVHRLPARTIAL